MRSTTQRQQIQISYAKSCSLPFKFLCFDNSSWERTQHFQIFWVKTPIYELSNFKSMKMSEHRWCSCSKTPQDFSRKEAPRTWAFYKKAKEVTEKNDQLPFLRVDYQPSRMARTLCSFKPRISFGERRNFSGLVLARHGRDSKSTTEISTTEIHYGDSKSTTRLWGIYSKTIALE